jgi:hypothetical protein
MICPLCKTTGKKRYSSIFPVAHGFFLAHQEMKNASLIGKIQTKNRHGWKTAYNDALVLFLHWLWLSSLLQK